MSQSINSLQLVGAT